jgi:hypothetical protein
MGPEDAVQWIYHSPHLQMFVKEVMGFNAIFPYHSDLGVAVNIMRPHGDAKTALGFHFDSIDSSLQVDMAGNQNAKGATGVIGIQDCTVGGERLTFPSVTRNKVAEVEQVVNNFNPLDPGRAIGESVPVVVNTPVAGVLSVFNGGNVLHSVSSVREGLRIAAVFLYSEKKTTSDASSVDSANAFYGGA